MTPKITHTLVTFLGKGRDDPKTGYRRANYQFPDITRSSAFFGLALAEHIQPDRLAILGTRASQWDLLVESLTSDGEDLEARIELMEAVIGGRVEQDLLDRLTPALAKGVGREVTARLIPYADDEPGQMAILETVAKVAVAGRVSFDLTHGFRHLGMVGFLSAFLLERIGKVKVEGLWYGALEMTRDGVTPVLRLDGLMAVQRWIDALDQFEATGDYGVFADLLAADGAPADKTQCLREAAFLERTLNLGDAVEKLRTFLPVLSKPLSGASGLFQQQLRSRLDWAREEGLEKHQRRLAHLYLQRGDYVRAAMFGWEALVTRECGARNLDPHDFRGGRPEAIEQLEWEIEADEHPAEKRLAYWRLKNLRNALAHGGKQRDRRLRALLRQREELTKVLQTCFKVLLDG